LLSATGQLAYERKTDRAVLDMNGSATAWEFGGNRDLPRFGGSLGTDLSTKAGKRTLIGVRASAAYFPFFHFSPLLFDGGSSNEASSVSDGGLLATRFPLGASPDAHLDLKTATGMTTNLSSKSSISATLEWHEWRFVNNPASNLDTLGAQATFNHRVTRAVILHASYGREAALFHEPTAPQQSVTSGGGSPQKEAIDVGADYGDALTFARRAFISLGGSTTAIRLDNQTRYRFIGNAFLSRGFARTWSASVGYVRDTEFVAGFREPLLTDSGKGWIGGLLAHRVRWGGGGAYSHGTVGFDDSQRFHTFSITTRMEIALKRSMGLSAEYSIQDYQIPAYSTSLLLSDQNSHQAVAFGLILWAPIISDGRGVRDSR
jgi:hypothetical protein